MPPRSHRHHVIEPLKTACHNRATWGQLTTDLAPRMSADRVREVVRLLSDDPAEPLWIVNGGVQYFGLERCKDPGLYRAVVAGISKSWAKRAGLGRAVRVHVTCRPTKSGDGEWRNPDLVIEAHRKATATERVQLDAIEVEQPDGFDIRSVYQAYEQGRGAHFAWVLTTGKLPATDVLERIEVAAAELGVGIVHMPRPTAPSGWVTLVHPRPRLRTETATERFVRDLGLELTPWQSGAERAGSRVSSEAVEPIATVA